MNTPQIVLIVLYVVSLTVSLMKHGERAPNYNFFATAAAVGINVLILYWGGFWS